MVDAIVVGAGPAGASTAYHLARRGRSVVLLDRQAFPRDKSCGDGLTLPAVRLLGEMGLLAEFADAQRVRGVRVLMRGQGSRDFEYPRGIADPDYGLVVPRLDLDHYLCRRAVEAGAELWQEALAVSLTRDDGRVTGVEAIRDGERLTLRAPVVVAADGAASRLARQVGLPAGATQSMGYALRGYYAEVEGLTDLLEIYLPLMDPTDQYLLPSYGWVFPTGSSTANVGVGLFRREQGANVRELLTRFLSDLVRNDPRFRRARLAAPWRGAPLRFDFAPERSIFPGLLLVGDAAGMISPFTGEGISYALESGKLAAEVIDRNLRSGGAAPDLTDYALLLEQRYTGYFEVGRQSARRYLLVWHVLQSTFRNEQPLFALFRRAALFPEGIGEAYAHKVLDDVSPLIARGELRVREDLLAVGEVLLDAVRSDWPFLGRLSATGHGDPGIPFRPALLLLLASYFGNPREPRLIRIGAAIELGFLSALAHMSVEDDRSGISAADGHRPANWGNMLALMVGDFALSKAYEISAVAGASVSRLIADALARACEGRMRELEHAYDLGLTERAHLGIVARKTATLFELPCRLGARLAGAPPAAERALARYGRRLGIAFQLADDALDLAGRAPQLGKATGADIREGVYSLAVLRTLRRRDSHGRRLRALLGAGHLREQELGEALDLIRADNAIATALTVARRQMKLAQAALTDVPDNAARRSLIRLAEYAVSRQIPKSEDVRSALVTLE